MRHQALVVREFQLPVISILPSEYNVPHWDYVVARHESGVVEPVV
jgi:hypothetical protein